LTHYDVIVYGLVCLDVIWRVPHLPPLGRAVRIQEERKVIGGEAANTAIALSRWGVRVALLGNALGDDDEGRLLRSLLARDAPGVDAHFLGTAPDTDTLVPVLVATPDGQKTIFGRDRTRLRFPVLSPELARSAAVFTADGSAGSAGERACEVASRVGMFVIVTNYSEDLVGGTRAAISVVSADDVEAGNSPAEWTTFAGGLRDRCGATVILTCGERGCFLAERNGRREEARHFPACAAPRMVDSTGAGDVFRAGLIYGRLHGWDLQDTIRFSSAAAALGCGEMGGWAGVRPIPEILAFQRVASTYG